MKKKSIAIGSDHAGYRLKEKIKDTLEKTGYVIKDFGAFSEESVDYPDFAHPISDAIRRKEFDTGILICGSGNGINMVANKHQGIRSALCWNKDIAVLARQHNDANIIALPARFIDEQLAKEIVDVFLNTDFEGGRHQNRVNKIDC